MTDDPYDDAELPPALGLVVDEGRGSLPFALIHGEALVACAAWALGEAGVTPVDLGTAWAGAARAEEPFVLHDALCPMTPAAFIAACVAQRGRARRRRGRRAARSPTPSSASTTAWSARPSTASGCWSGRLAGRAAAVGRRRPRRLPGLDFAASSPRCASGSRVELVEAPPAAAGSPRRRTCGARGAHRRGSATPF